MSFQLRLRVILGGAALLAGSFGSAEQSAVALDVLDARGTQRFLATQSGRFQTVIVTVRNTGEHWIRRERPVRITIEGDEVTTAAPAFIEVLAPGEITRAEVGISTALEGTRTAPVHVIATIPGGEPVILQTSISVGVPDYGANPEYLANHESPAWFDNAKFGIFITWGVYSVPAWAPSGWEYAEWYWNSLNQKGSPTYEHHLKTFGPSATYDDFIPALTGLNFNPHLWMELILASQARYFVFVSKHHDGFALYDTATTGRKSVVMGPRRDIAKELFEAGKEIAPDVKRGIYYSLYEWFHPGYTGRLPSHPYSLNPMLYTGAWPIEDFVAQHVLPQMRELIDGYDPDILWCDGSWEKDAAYWQTGSVIARYFTQAMRREIPKDVVVNNRCRVTDPYESVVAADFTTPEYKSYSSIVTRKWESSRGLDPYSYGYNRDTPDAAYMTAKQVVDSLVDIVSKNGNLLLNIGPAADGSVPAIMQLRLREIGEWLSRNGEAIFDTTYWWRTPEEGSLRFTVKPNEAFYIIALAWPDKQLVVTSPVPIAEGQTITLLGHQGGPLPWTRRDGRLIVDLPADGLSAGQHAWVFKIAWY